MADKLGILPALLISLRNTWGILFQSIRALLLGVGRAIRFASQKARDFLLLLHKLISGAINYGFSISLFTLIASLPLVAYLDPLNLWNALAARTGDDAVWYLRIATISVLLAISGTFIWTFAKNAVELRRTPSEQRAASRDGFPALVSSMLAWLIIGAVILVFSVSRFAVALEALAPHWSFTQDVTAMSRSLLGWTELLPARSRGGIVLVGYGESDKVAFKFNMQRDLAPRTAPPLAVGTEYELIYKECRYVGVISSVENTTSQSTAPKLSSGLECPRPKSVVIAWFGDDLRLEWEKMDGKKYYIRFDRP